MYSNTHSAGRTLVGTWREAEAALVERDDLTGGDVADKARADDVERAGLRGDGPALGPVGVLAGGEYAERERTQAVGVAEGDHAVAGHEHDREGAAQAREDVGDRVLDRLGRVGGDQRGDDLRVGRGAERDAARTELLVELDGVDQVAVVGERQLARGPVGALRTLDGLGVLPGVGAGRRVADVPDRQLAGERAQVVLREHLADEP